MKKTFLILAALLTMSSASFAGGDFDFAIGPKVGYQTTRLSYNKADIKSGFSNHFTAGIFSRITLGRFYVQPEVLYFNTSDIINVTATGSESDNLFNLPTTANINMTLNSMNLQVPVLLGMNFLDAGIITLRAQVGPTANFILQSKTLYDKTYSLDGNQHEISNVTTDEKFDTKNIAWGFQAGLGIDLLRRITLDINYNFGLSKVINSLDGTVLGDTFDFNKIDDSHKDIFMVTVGFKFL